MRLPKFFMIVAVLLVTVLCFACSRVGNKPSIKDGIANSDIIIDGTIVAKD